MDYKTFLRKTILNVLNPKETEVCKDGKHCAQIAGLTPPEHDEVLEVTFGQHHGHGGRMLKGIFWQVVTGQALTQNYFTYLVPINIPCLLTIDRLGIVWEDPAPVTSSFKMALYRDNGDTPSGGALVVGTPVGLAIAGTNRKQEITVADTQVTPGLYWLAVITDVGGSVTEAMRTANPEGTGGTLFMWRAVTDYATFPPDPCPVAISQEGVGPMLMYVRVKSVP
jgi:hypothetical protein